MHNIIPRDGIINDEGIDVNPWVRGGHRAGLRGVRERVSENTIPYFAEKVR